MSMMVTSLIFAVTIVGVCVRSTLLTVMAGQLVSCLIRCVSRLSFRGVEGTRPARAGNIRFSVTQEGCVVSVMLTLTLLRAEIFSCRFVVWTVPRLAVRKLLRFKRMLHVRRPTVSC